MLSSLLWWCGSCLQAQKALAITLCEQDATAMQADMHGALPTHVLALCMFKWWIEERPCSQLVVFDWKCVWVVTVIEAFLCYKAWFGGLCPHCITMCLKLQCAASTVLSFHVVWSPVLFLFSGHKNNFATIMRLRPLLYVWIAEVGDKYTHGVSGSTLGRQDSGWMAACKCHKQSELASPLFKAWGMLWWWFQLTFEYIQLVSY